MWGLRLALDATYSLEENPTGVGVYSREILHGLAAAHNEVRWLWCYRGHRFARSLGESLPPGCSRRLFNERWAPRANLFHGLNQRLPALRHHRAVATFHDLFVLTGNYSTPEFRARFAAQARAAAEQCDLIIAVSQFTASQVTELLHVPDSRVRVIPHGVRVPNPIRVAAPEQIVLSVGALQRRKNTVRLVEAFEQMPESWSLMLAGSTGFGGQEALDRIATSSRRASIHALGYVDNTTLNELYSRASIFAFPSLDEGFGMPVLEAMARGVAVVTSRRSALPEVAGDAALLVNPESSDEIADALCRLAGDENLRLEIGKRGISRARQFRWEDSVEKTWRIYQELICSPRNGDVTVSSGN
jgi:glycosyltransferase involved in cell wall biosynthesis